MTNDEIFQATNTALQGVDVMAAAAANSRGRKWAEKQAKIQREQNLADWKMQNDYNSPTAQMARLKEAGLNPNLVYGKGADNTAAAVSSATQARHEEKSPNFGAMGDSLFRYQDTALKNAQTDNLKTQNTVLTQQVVESQAKTAGELIRNAKTDQERVQAAEMFGRTLTNADLMAEKLRNDLKLFPGQFDAQQEDLRQKRLQTGIMANKEERDAAAATSSLREAAERILTMRNDRLNKNAVTDRQIDQMDIEKVIKQNESIIKQFDADMVRRGIRPGDAQWYRALDELLRAFGRDAPGVPGKIKQGLKEDKWGIF